jgi:hypothetical protein
LYARLKQSRIQRGKKAKEGKNNTTTKLGGVREQIVITARRVCIATKKASA